MQIFDVGDVFAHCFDGFAAPKLFVYALCRLGGAFGGRGMLIGLTERDNSILTIVGMHGVEMDNVALLGDEWLCCYLRRSMQQCPANASDNNSSVI